MLTAKPRLYLWVSLTLISSCGPAASGTVAVLPINDRDPPPYTPPPSPTARSGQPTGVALSGGYEQARIVALRVVEAVRDEDRGALERLLADPVLTMFPRLGQQSRQRLDVIEAAFNPTRRGNLDRNVPLEQLIAADAIEVSPLSRALEGRPLPPGLEPTDLQVVIQLKPRGRQVFHRLLGWTIQGGMVVRPGIDPRVIAL